MEKLIELLNEYEEQKKKETGLRAYEWESYGDGHLIQATNIVNKKRIPLALIETRSLLISKTYGFIQWLVDNDKILLGDIALKVYDLDLRAGKHTYTEYPIYESLLMLLSIKDNPIEFLISILK